MSPVTYTTGSRSLWWIAPSHGDSRAARSPPAGRSRRPARAPRAPAATRRSPGLRPAAAGASAPAVARGPRARYVASTPPAPRRQHLGDLLLRHAEPRRLARDRRPRQPWARRLEAVVGVDDVRRRVEQLAQRVRRRAAAPHRTGRRPPPRSAPCTGGPGGTSTTCTERRWRRPIAASCRPHGQRDVVALAVALVLVDEVHLQVAEFGLLAQVVLTHQTVEVDRRRRARVRLEIRDLRQPRAPRRASSSSTRGRGLERRALRHVQRPPETPTCCRTAASSARPAAAPTRHHRRDDRGEDAPVQPVPTARVRLLASRNGRTTRSKSCGAIARRRRRSRHGVASCAAEAACATARA